MVVSKTNTFNSHREFFVIPKPTRILRIFQLFTAEAPSVFNSSTELFSQIQVTIR